MKGAGGVLCVAMSMEPYGVVVSSPLPTASSDPEMGMIDAVEAD